MKNTVWAFGDSFSEEVTSLPVENERLRYVREYLNGVPYKTWIGIVADKLNYNYRNHAASGGKYFDHLRGGNSNDQMFYNVTEYSNEFKRGDIVVIGFTNTGRYQVVKPDGGIMSVLPNQDLGPHTERYLKNYIDRNDNPYYVHEMMQKFKILETLSNVVGFKIYYWNWTHHFETMVPDLNPKNWIIHEMYDKWIQLRDIVINQGSKFLSIEDETNGDCKDGHWGKVVNDTLGNVFYEHIKNKI